MTKVIDKIVAAFNRKQNTKFSRGMIESIIEHDTGLSVKIEDDAFNEIKIGSSILNVWTTEEELEIF